MDIEKLVEQLLSAWRAQRVPFRPGVTPEELAAFERRYNVRVPIDLRAFLATTDGMEPNVMDASLFRFWPLGEIEPSGDGRSFLFADHCLSALLYAIDLSGTANGIVISATEPIRVASSFSDFLDSYVRDPELLLR